MVKRFEIKSGFIFLLLSALLLLLVPGESAADCAKVEAWARKGILEMYEGDVNKALNYLQKGAGLQKKGVGECDRDHIRHYNIGIGYGMIGDYANMIQHMVRSLKLRPNFRPASLNLAWALINEGKHKQGLSIIRDLEKEGKRSATQLITAFSYLFRKNREKFDEYRKKAVELGMKEKESWFEELQAIKKETKRKVDTRPRLPILPLDLARLYEKIGDYENAEKYYAQSTNRTARLRFVSMLKQIKSPRDKIRYHIDPLIDWTGKAPADVEYELTYKRYLSYPEGVMIFIYPEAFVTVSDGVFNAGQPGIRRSDKNDFWEHEVYIKGFKIGKYEVSNIEYMLFVESTGFPSPYNTHNAGYDLWECGRFEEGIGLQAVVSVSWYDVKRYMKWKSGITGMKYKLPTEERWEKAARGSGGQIYPWGNAPPSPKLANFGKNWNDEDKIYITIADVDKYPKGISPYGAYNMAGNVWEWTSSTYKSFFYDDPNIEIESTEIKRNELKVFRGGAWINKGEEIRSTFRNRNWPTIRYNGVGFRLVRE